MCSICSGVGVPVCATGVICSANFHQLISFALLSGSTMVGSVIGFLRTTRDAHEKK